MHSCRHDIAEKLLVALNTINHIKSNLMHSQRHMSWSFFVFSDLWWEVIVCFVDISEIVDHHYLNFLFIKAQVSLQLFLVILYPILLCGGS